MLALAAWQVDAQPNPVVLPEEPDDHAPWQRPFRIGHGEDAALLQLRHDAVEVAQLGGRDEQDLTAADVGDRGVALDRKRMLLHRFAAHHLVEIVPQRVIAENADHERGAVAGQSRRRPFDEMSEVEQEHRFELGLRHRCGDTRQPAGEQQQRAAQPQCAGPVVGQKPHVMFANTLRTICSRPGDGKPYSVCRSCSRLRPTIASSSCRLICQASRESRPK